MHCISPCMEWIMDGLDLDSDTKQSGKMQDDSKLNNSNGQELENAESPVFIFYIFIIVKYVLDT